MRDKIRFGEYVREVTVQMNDVSYTHLMPKVKYDDKGGEIPYQPTRLTLRSLDVFRLLQPYVSVRFLDQFKAVVPLAIYLGLFQFVVLRQNIKDASIIAGGLTAAILGLMFFMEGLKLGLMPIGEILGNTLPRKVKLPVVLTLAFILGVGVTFAEPAIGSLQIAGSIVNPEKAPYLYLLLNEWSLATVLVVGIGVGIAAVLGTVRFIKNWSLKPIIYTLLVPTIVLTVLALLKPEVSKIIGLAWDCGAVTTGPVTVPLVLALGIGVAAAVGKGNSSLSGFGIVTLASIFPILGVLLLGFAASFIVPPESIAGAATVAAESSVAVLKWYQKTPGVEIITGIRAIVPLVLFLFFVLSFILHEKLANSGIIRYGIVLALIGMILFNIGLSYGLSKLGDQSGSLTPGAFTRIGAIDHSPLYPTQIGILIAAVFAFILGFGATMAEPALNALGITVETLTNGVFKKSFLIYAVSSGVATGIMIGVIKIIFSFSIVYILLPCYILAIVLTWFSREDYVNIGWDSAGVTTGPVTVPLVLAMGLGFGKAVGATEGFGVLAAASVCPIISVLGMGVFVQWRMKQINKAKTGEAFNKSEVVVP